MKKKLRPKYLYLVKELENGVKSLRQTHTILQDYQAFQQLLLGELAVALTDWQKLHF
jgi:hypothetical protein